jgi:uncharacterized paraquat-inducible protein A
MFLNMPRQAQNSTSAKEHSQTVLNHARAVKISQEASALKLKNAKTQAETKLILARVEQLLKNEEPQGIEQLLQQIGINTNNVEINSKGFMGCAQCNVIDGSGKETKCHKCGKPLTRVSQGWD